MAKKVQLPVVGGIRKVVLAGSAAAAGTTIAEFGSNTVTLAQLAAALGTLVASDTGTIGDGPVPAIALGPGLSGGGPLLGVVPINLTSPIQSHFLYDDSGGGSDDSFSGFSGVSGPAGAKGAPGASFYLSGDDGADGDIGLPGARGIAGAPGASAPIFFPEDGVDGESFTPNFAYPGSSAGVTFANPTAKVGLTTVNGVATTAMRSDGAPPIDLTISPTWTGNHTFGAQVVINEATATATALVINAFDTTGVAYQQYVGGGGNNGYVGVNGSAGAIIVGATTGDLCVRADNNVSIAAGNANLRMQISAALSFLGPSAGSMVDMTPDSGTFTGTLTGLSTTVTGTMTWYKIGKLILISAPGSATMTGTSNAATLTMTGLPTNLQPSGARLVKCTVFNNGINVDAVGLVNSGSGTIQFLIGNLTGVFTTYSSALFTTTGTKGLNSTLLIYNQ